MDDLLSDFLTECGESMFQLDAELVELECNPDDPALIASIFRLIHTIKGTCAFLDLPRLQTVAHAAENVLGQLRDRELATTPAVITLLFRALDRVKEILDALARDPSEPTGDDTELIAALDALADQEPTRAAATAGAGRAEEPGRRAGAESLAAPTLRVPVDLLEELMTLVGELVLTRDQLLEAVRHDTDPALKSPLQRLNQITGALQEGVTRTRMQAIGTAWRTLPRLTRDLALELDKEIVLETHGAETELDRQVLEMIKAPLTHMVRNAADHGLERPDERRRMGKPGRGTIGLTAFHASGHIVIEVRDDGKGIDTRRIAEQAVARGLVTEADIGAMTEADIQKLILHPGVSTAETVTAVSGRGVGMDVVRTNIKKIGGTIEINSTRGQGSLFTIKIPLTLAIVQKRAIADETGTRAVHGWPALGLSTTRSFHARAPARFTRRSRPLG